MDTDNNLGNHPLNFQNKFPTYDRAGRFRPLSPDTLPFTRQLAAFRSASVTPLPKPVKGAPEKHKHLMNPVKSAEAVPKDKSYEFPKELILKPITETTRNSLEEMIRIKKRKHEKCPFMGENQVCCRPDLRCGDRAQFSGRESDKQQMMPHHSLYSPFFPSDHIIVVEQNQHQLEFILDSFKLFFNYDMEKIAPLSCAEEAIELLTKFKLQNRRAGLVILSFSDPDPDIFKLLTELYERNLNAEIILISQKENPGIIEEYTKRELAPGLPFISAWLSSPVHSDKFIETISSLHFGRFL